MPEGVGNLEDTVMSIMADAGASPQENVSLGEFITMVGDPVLIEGEGAIQVGKVLDDPGARKVFASYGDGDIETVMDAVPFRLGPMPAEVADLLAHELVPYADVTVFT